MTDWLWFQGPEGEELPGILDICNQALLLLGEVAMTALDEDSKAARLCSQFYNPCRNATLRAFPWRCATTRATLSTPDATPPWGYEYAFNLPSDCLRLLELDDPLINYRIEGSQLLTNEDSINIKYIKLVTDATLYDSLLVEALSALLAARLAYPLANSATLSQQMMQIYQGVLTSARGTDYVEQGEDEEPGCSWLDVRV